MNGAPLVYYSISVIRLYSDRHGDDKITVALNTDSKELQAIVKKQHILEDIIFVERKPELAGDKVAKEEVIRDTFLNELVKDKYDMVIDLDITSPLRTVEDIENAIDVFNKGQDYDLVFSVVESRRSPYFNMVEKKDTPFDYAHTR